MKNYGMAFLIMLGIIAGCSKENENVQTKNVNFLESEVLTTHGAGTSALTIIWDNAEWEITTDDGGFLSNFRFLKGGSVEHSGRTRVQFDYTENNTAGEREQLIHLKNAKTGKMEQLSVKQLPKPPIVLPVSSAIAYQQISGFGGMLNPALWQGNNQLTATEVEQLYGENGLGYNIMRIMIYPDPANWSRDLLIAKKAQSLGVRIFGSPWTPPAHMKSSKQQIGGSGGYLLPDFYQDYVDHLNAFVDYMAGNGVTIEAVSIQNEPDWDPAYDACVWTPQQILAFMKDYAQGIKVKVIAAEAVNFKKEYTDGVLNDVTARNNLDIVGTHLYGGGIGDYALARQHNKEIWMTEHLLNTNSADDWSWNQALVFGKEVHDCMAANFNAYIWWYLKRHYSMFGDGEYGTVTGQLQKRGYIMAHYAKYATGRKRINVGNISTNANFLVTAYEGSSDYTLVLQNQGSDYIPVLQFDLPAVVSAASGVESTETTNMETKNVVLTPDKKSVVVNIKPKSVISIKLNK